MLWLREYAIPLSVALTLHFVLLIWLASDFVGKTKHFELKPPKVITASLVRLKPLQKEVLVKPVQQPVPQAKKPEPKVEKKQLEKKPEIKKPDPKIEQQKKAAQEKRRLDLEKSRLEKAKQEKIKVDKANQEKERIKKEHLEKEKKEKLLKEQKKRENDLLGNLEDEELVEDAQQDQITAQSYISFIQRAIESNWNRPPSARNGMQVLLNIQLIPSGDVVQVNIAKSSGNDAFDRSAVAAVEKAGGFPELSELESRVFEKYYRRFTLLFKPEDLRL